MKRIGAFVIVSLVIVSATLIPAPLWAQAQSGIAGMVRDTSGAVLPGVTVEASSPALIEKSRTAITDGQGQYKILDLRPGTYVVTFNLAGFAPLKREGVALTSNFTATLNAELGVGTVEETVTVSGGSPTVDVQNVRVEKVLPREVLETLPSGRGISAYATVTPGVAVQSTFQDVGGTQNENWVALALHGGRSGDERILLDGLRLNHGGAGRAIMLNTAVVEDITLELSGMSAEDDSGGVVVKVIPKDGGNQFSFFGLGAFTNHSLQSSNLNDDLRARGLTQVNSVDHIWDVDGSVGGPLQSDKLWFFTAHRHWGRVARVGGTYYNLTQGTPVYTPDLSRQATRDEHNRDHTLRLTWQAARKHKLNAMMTYEDVCICQTGLGTTAAGPGFSYAPEATVTLHFFPNYMLQAGWSAPITSKLLLEAGAANVIHHEPRTAQAGIKPTDISMTELSTGFTYNAWTGPLCCAPGNIHNDQANARFFASYVTGSHALKSGVMFQHGRYLTVAEQNQDVTYSLLRGAPSSLTEWATPLTTRAGMNNVGLFAQDQWTIRRLTLNLGLRYDYYRGYVPDQHLPAVQFLPARDFSSVNNVPLYNDVNPRFGAAYDLFGDGKTALKFSFGRYVAALNGIVGINPVNAIVTNVSRTWGDTNGDFIPGCDLRNPAANGECGPFNNSTFGQTVFSTRYADDVTNGWGTRVVNWMTTAEVQRELRPGLSLNAGYYHRTYGNFTVTDNLAVGPSDYSPYSITAPVDSRLPGGGGFPVTGLYDVSPSKFGQVNNLVELASHYGDMKEVHNFFSVNLSGRFGRGVIVSGGIDTGRTTGAYSTGFTVGANHCFVVDSPQELRFCDVVIPFSAQTQLKLFGSYPLPWNLQASGSWQSLPGIPITASYVATNAQIAPSLGRNLSSGANGTAIVELIKPGTMYEGRINQVDLRLTKIIPIGGNRRRRVEAHFDLYNALNASPLLGLNTRYGPTWLRPIQILDGRLFKVAAQLNF